MDYWARFGRRLRSPRVLVAIGIGVLVLVISYFVSPFLFAVLIIGGVAAVGVLMIPGETKFMIRPPDDTPGRGREDDPR